MADWVVHGQRQMSNAIIALHINAQLYRHLFMSIYNETKSSGEPVSARQDGPIGRFMSPFINPGVFDFWAAQVNPIWSWDRPLAQIVSRHVEAKDTVTLTLKLNRHGVRPVAGQHLNVSAQVNGRRVTRSYSPTAIDARKNTVAITVKQIAGGVLSTHLSHHAQVGDVLELGEPFGTMTWPTKVQSQAPGKWLLMAAGSGITPLIRLIRQAQTFERKLDVTLIYWARTRADLCFVPELRALAGQQSGLTVHFVLTQEATLLSDEASGRLDLSLLQALVPDWAERRTYACGPSGFVETAKQIVSPAAPLFVGESFSLPAPIASDSAGKLVRVTLQSSGRALDVRSGQSLLAALEAHGMSPASGCRMGICHTCVCPKTAGTTQNLVSGERNSEPESGLRLCISSASSDITLDL